MRDFPIFTTEHGVSSLTLREIPYRRTAYIRVMSALSLSEHLGECVDFCLCAGAERIFADGHQGLNGYPLHSEILRMQMTARFAPELTAQLFPVTEATAPRWRALYNARMAKVDHARTLQAREEGLLIRQGAAYFVHREETLLGIGWLEGATLRAMAAVRPGAGETVMHTLMSTLEGQTVRLEVASTNTPALNLYRRLGFCQTEVVERWRQIL